MNLVKIFDEFLKIMVRLGVIVEYVERRPHVITNESFFDRVVCIVERVLRDCQIPVFVVSPTGVLHVFVLDQVFQLEEF